MVRFQINFCTSNTVTCINASTNYTLLKQRNISVQKPASAQICINEDLVDNNRRLISAAEGLVQKNQLKGAWSSNCRVRVHCLGDSIHAFDNLDALTKLLKDAHHMLRAFQDDTYHVF